MAEKQIIYLIDGNKIKPIRTRNPDRYPKWYSTEKGAKMALIRRGVKTSQQKKTKGKKKSKSVEPAKKIQFYVLVDGKPKRIRTATPEDYPVRFKNRQEAEDAINFDFTMTRGTLNISLAGKSYTITATDERFNGLRTACMDEDYPTISKLISIGEEIKKQEGFEVKGTSVHLDGDKLPDNLSETIVRVVKKKMSPSILTKFRNRLKKNPDKKVRENLFKFMDQVGFLFSENGWIIGYKYVRNDYKDEYSGTRDYTPGKTVTQDRKFCNSDPKQGCSSGLHVGTWDYVYSNEKIVLVLVDPKDVVSVPDDYNFSKMRCCKVKSLCDVDERIDTHIISNNDLKRMGAHI